MIAALHSPALSEPASADLDQHRIALINEDGSLETVFTAPAARSVLTWTREWLRNPIGLAFVIVPPGVEMPELANSGRMDFARL